jgi:hypothetical protein
MTWSHLNCSQPSQRENTQIPRVRQVSIVDRAVAESDLVTASPQKLKNAILWVTSRSAREGEEGRGNEPDGDHDAAAPDCRVRYDLVPALRCVEVASLASGSAADEEVENGHRDEGRCESKGSFVPDCELHRIE